MELDATSGIGTTTGHNEEGFPRRLVVTTDITEQKLAQQALLESLQHRASEMQIITRSVRNSPVRPRPGRSTIDW